jgi:hypothetical protein
MGKTKIYIMNWVDEFRHTDSNGYIARSENKEQIEHYDFIFEFEAYNSSSNINIMRNIHINFYNGNKCIYSIIPHDISKTEYRNHMSINHAIEPVNLPPKSVQSYKLSNSISKEDMKFIWDTTKIMFQYSNKKNINKKIKIKEADYKAYFETLKLPDKNN